MHWLITFLPRFLLRSLAVSTLSDLTLYQSSSGEEEAHIPDVHSSISGLLMDISNRFVITCGDKVARVFHNVAGYKGQLIRTSIAMITACPCIFHMIRRSNTVLNLFTQFKTCWLFVPTGTITENKEKIINNRAGKLVEERLRKEIEEAQERLAKIL